MFVSEYGAKGQGSRSPSALICINPLPAERQPPKASSSPGKLTNRPGRRSLNDSSFSASEARCSSVITSSSVPFLTGMYSTKKKSLHPESISSFIKVSSVIVSKLRLDTVKENHIRFPLGSACR